MDSKDGVSETVTLDVRVRMTVPNETNAGEMQQSIKADLVDLGYNVTEVEATNFA